MSHDLGSCKLSREKQNVHICSIRYAKEESGGKYKEAGCRGVSRTLYAPEVVQNSKKFK